MARIRIAFIAFLASALPAADVESLLQQVARYEYGQSPAAARDLEAAVRAASNDPAEAKRMEAHFIRLLESTATLAGKDQVCRHLSVMGTAASVPVLAKLLMQKETAEMARYALERIPGDEPVAALRQALPSSPGKAGIVTSLGRRRDPRSVPLLTPLLADPAVAPVAAVALGNIGGPAAVKALQASRLPEAADALLRIAESSAGAQSLAIYKALNVEAQPQPIRIAALLGTARISGKAALPQLRAALAGSDAALQSAAIAALTGIPGSEVTKTLAGALEKAPPYTQVQILTALASHSGPAAVPSLVTGAASTNQEVRIASLRGLGIAGDPAQVSLLAARAAKAAGEEQAQARLALARLPGADNAILGAIPAAESAVKIELIRASGERGIRTAPPVLLKTAKDADAGVRKESIRALRETAAPSHAHELIAALVKAQDEESKEYERAVAAALRRSKDVPVDDLLAAWQSAANSGVKGSLLSVMAMTGSDQTLPAARTALKSDDAELRRTAILALSEWPTPAPLPDLLDAARNAPTAAHQILALRGYIKLAQLPSDAPPAESVKHLAEAMSIAKRPDEKKAVLAALQRFITEEALALAKSALNDPAVAAEAKAAVTRLERGLQFRRK